MFFIKIVKYTFVAFVLSCIFSLSGVKAATYQSYVGFNLPALRDVASLGTLDKKDYKNHVFGIISTKNARDVYVRLIGKTKMNANDSDSTCIGGSGYYAIGHEKNSENSKFATKTEVNTETSTSSYGMCPGTVDGEMKTVNTYLNKTYMNGSWFSSVDVFDQLYTS